MKGKVIISTNGERRNLPGNMLLLMRFLSRASFEMTGFHFEAPRMTMK